MPQFRRRLPHEYPSGKPLFLTWHLYGSLPASRYPPPGHLKSGQAFVWMDRCLDTTRRGPLYLRDARIARIVADSIHQGGGVLAHYELQAYVIMANHVHLLVVPLVPPSRFLQSLKGFTAREANKVLGQTGRPFWQRESYDHWVRNEQERLRIKNYIEQNPVKAGLVEKPEDYPWSSAGRVIALRTTGSETRRGVSP